MPRLALLGPEVAGGVFGDAAAPPPCEPSQALTVSVDMSVHRPIARSEGAIARSEVHILKSILSLNLRHVAGEGIVKPVAGPLCGQPAAGGPPRSPSICNAGTVVNQPLTQNADVRFLGKILGDVIRA